MQITTQLKNKFIHGMEGNAYLRVDTEIAYIYTLAHMAHLNASLLIRGGYMWEDLMSHYLAAFHRLSKRMIGGPK